MRPTKDSPGPVSRDQVAAPSESTQNYLPAQGWGCWCAWARIMVFNLKTQTTLVLPCSGQIQDLDSDGLLLFLEIGGHTILRNILPFIE